MPTTDRTTLTAVLDALVARMREDLVSDPPTATKPLRCLLTRSIGRDTVPRPCASMVPHRARPIAASEDDRLLEVTVRWRVAADHATGDASGELAAMLGAIEDAFDALRDSGLMEGVDGFDVRDWTLKVGDAVAGAGVVTAEAEMTFVARVARGENG